MSETAPLTIGDLESRIDQLTQAMLHLAAELWVARDRQAVLEHVLSEAGIDAVSGIDQYQPDPESAVKLAGDRDALIAGLLGYLSPEA